MSQPKSDSTNDDLDGVRRLRVCGVALHALRMQFPRHCDFLILDVQWAEDGHRDAED